MSLSEEHIAQFDRRFDGTLNDQERIDFDEKLKADKAFEERYDQYIQSSNFIKTWAIGEEMKDIINAKNKKKKRPKNWLLYAAAIALVLGSTFVLLNQSNSLSNEELFGKYYEPYPADNNLRGISDENQAMLLYKNKKYSEATSAFTQLTELNPENEKYRLFLGICYLQQDLITQSINQFKLISGSTSNTIKNNSDWYLALAYFKAGQSSKAKEVLIEIKNSNHLFSNKAEVMLQELDR
ncbi:MAG: tetratricopeptide repeat protein [Reichenbachiella sp.]|uniref:tetratricopeptide repeat protein n=1 Tax=Reichenbachiella sp. TaxID=2184521 RepID=UPI003297C787